MKINEEIASNINEYLLQIKAIKLNVETPFTWSSGIKSPIYCDNRVTLSYPKIRTYIRQQFVKVITEEFGSVDLIAGVATGAIANGALIAQELGLPFAYVRSAEKKHGLSNVIEGVVESGQSVVVIEDLVSTGGSSLNVVESLRAAGCDVKGMIAIFTYGLKIAEENFKQARVPLYTLSSYEKLIQDALKSGYIKESDVQSLTKFHEDPKTWWDRQQK